MKILVALIAGLAAICWVLSLVADWLIGKVEREPKTESNRKRAL
jgi:hypothetical protein